MTAVPQSCLFVFNQEVAVLDSDTWLSLAFFTILGKLAALKVPGTCLRRKVLVDTGGWHTPVSAEATLRDIVTCRPQASRRGQSSPKRLVGGPASHVSLKEYFPANCIWRNISLGQCSLFKKKKSVKEEESHKHQFPPLYIMTLFRKYRY